MNTIVKIFTIPILAMSLLTSCEKKPEVKAAVEFGTVRFKEPFVGVLKLRPAILEKSLKYPPYSWFVPDTVTVMKTMKVEVNDEFLRGKIDAKFALVGPDGRPYDGVTFKMGNIPIEDYVFKPVQSDNRIAVTCRVNPSIGNADLTGNVIVSSKGLDLVNGLAVSTDETAVMDWHITQKQKVNWPLWLVWLITALLILALVLLILYFIVKFIIFILKYIASALKSLIDAITKRLKSVSGDSKVKIKMNGSNFREETESEKDKKKREPKEKEDSVFFEPWIGKNYYSGGMFGKRIMVLGESHYCESGCPNCGVGNRCKDFTTKVIKNYLDPNAEHEGWMNTYKKFERSLVNRQTTQKESVRIWNSILFYNFLQVAMGGPRQAGTAKQYRDSARAFFSVLDKYEPELMIVWGDQLWQHLPWERWTEGETLKVDRQEINNGYYSLSNGRLVRVICVCHPSAGYSWDFWYKVISKA